MVKVVFVIIVHIPDVFTGAWQIRIHLLAWETTYSNKEFKISIYQIWWVGRGKLPRQQYLAPQPWTSTSTFLSQRL